MIAAKEILSELLRLELVSNAIKLGLVNSDKSIKLDEEFLVRAISVLNELSIQTDEGSRKQLIAICALLWTYRLQQWTGLKEYIILFLSRAGFGPSSIMIDSEYSHELRQFSSGESILNQFSVALAQVKNEIIVGGKTFLLTDFQKEIWGAIETNQLLGISAPTSAGKSFLILLKGIDLLLKKKGPVIYVVPTLSLVSQVLADFRKMLDEFSLLDSTLETTFNIDNATENSIYVLTQEKAIAAFSQSDKPFQHLRLLVIDEIQNVERVADSDDQRAKVLYDLMIELRNTTTVDHIIISGPRIIKLDEFGKRVFDLTSEKRETNASPVLNLTYSINKGKGSAYHFTVHSDLMDAAQSIDIENSTIIQGYGKVMYTDEYLEYLGQFLSGFPTDESNIVFSPTSAISVKIGDHLASKKEDVNSEYLNGLSDFISSSVHPKFSLAQTVRKAVAYHHGKLPYHIRLLVEDGIKRKEILTTACTTTLLQGVNLPVQNIIIRNPNLFTKKTETSVKLTNYEIANLRGRAGRLLKDFVGRTYILDELSFKEREAQQLDLFQGESKELNVGYGQTFNAHKESIKLDIQNQVGSTLENKDYSFLTTYIRQAAIRHGTSTQVFLSRVGINLTDDEMNAVFSSMLSLTVTREVCAKNRYWDPVDLNRVVELSSRFTLPTSASELNISYKLKNVLILLRANFPTYYQRYFGVQDVPKKDILLQKCILAENWLKERSLSDVLNTPYYDDSENIDEAISFIQNKVSFGLPLLLKPLYDVKDPASMFTRFIELGAFKPLTRRLIELSVPRETSIFLANNFSFEKIDDQKELIKQIRTIREKMSYWHKVQLSSL